MRARCRAPPRTTALDTHTHTRVVARPCRGAILYHRFHRRGLRVAMQALLDFRGFRLVRHPHPPPQACLSTARSARVQIAMPLLPLSEGSIVYGSNDKGATVHNDDSAFSELMRACAEEVRLSMAWTAR
jgi:hypothetical protein